MKSYFPSIWRLWPRCTQASSRWDDPAAGSGYPSKNVVHRAGQLFRMHQREIWIRTDRMFAGLMALQWVAGILFALVISPQTWSGAESQINPHVWAAVFLGGVIASVPIFLALRLPGTVLTRQVIAVGQMLTSALFIHLLGGRIEGHFHVFGSLAFLACYRDWRVLATATLVTALDHFLRGIFAPETVYGIEAPSQWRWLEHAAWVIFEDIFLIISIRESLPEMFGNAERQARLELTNAHLDQRVTERTKELETASQAALKMMEEAVQARETVEAINKEMQRQIGQRQRAEESQARLAMAVEQSAEAVVITDPDANILYVNPAFERCTGYSKDEAVGKNARILKSGKHDAAFYQKMWSTLSEGRVWEGRFINRKKDGTTYEEEALISTIRDAGGRIVNYVAVKRDITEKLKNERLALRSQRMESIGTLAGGIAHDLNNVLAPIMMSIELLKIKETDPRRLSMLATIGTSAKRGAAMVRQVLSFARGVEGEQEEVHMTRLLAEIEKISNETFLKSIRVRSDIQDGLWTVQGDATQLHQVLLNLCVNARDAMPSGGTLTITASNVMLDEHYAGMNSEAKHGPHVVIQVEDTGTGMPPEVIDRIFEPFFTTKELGKGTGLGLSTSMAIVKGHGGFVRVYSEVGVGTKFRIHLPAIEDTRKTESTAIIEENELPCGCGELILVVDDESAIRQIAQHTLEAFGYRVLLACDGAEAAAIYASHRGDISAVITDMMMPIVDGLSTIQVLMRMNPQVRIVAASGLNANGMVAKAVSAGVKHFISKPYSAETLLKTMRDLLKAPSTAPGETKAESFRASHSRAMAPALSN
ncbi:MAG TPA: PAS domain S-box protein [Prosthecobacter sp.]